MSIHVIRYAVLYGPKKYAVSVVGQQTGQPIQIGGPMLGQRVAARAFKLALNLEMRGAPACETR